MSRKIRNLLFFLCLAIMAISAVITIPNKAEENPNQLDFSSSTPPGQSTVFAERTAIAIFTKNPTLALSSTPFYAEIIFNEVVRNLTETPFPRRSYYLYPTPTVSAQEYTPELVETNQFTLHCVATLSTLSASETSDQIQNLLVQQQIDAVVNVVSTGVEGIDQNCTIPFQAIQSKLQISMKVDAINDSSLLNSMIAKILEILAEHWQNLQYVARNSWIMIYFESGSEMRSVIIPSEKMFQMYKAGLKETNFLELFE